MALGTALFYSGAFFLFGLAWFFLAHSYGSDRLPGWRGMPAAYYRDALAIGICGCAALAGLHRLPDLAAHFWPVARHALAANVPDALDPSQPALNAMAVAVTRSFFAVGVLALALGFASWYLRRAWQQMAIAHRAGRADGAAIGEALATSCSAPQRPSSAWRSSGGVRSAWCALISWVTS